MCLYFSAYQTELIQKRLESEGSIQGIKNVFHNQKENKVFSKHFKHKWKLGVNKSNRIWLDWFSEFFFGYYRRGIYVYLTSAPRFSSGHFIKVTCKKEHFLAAGEQIGLFSQVDWDGKVYNDPACDQLVLTL